MIVTVMLVTVMLVTVAGVHLMAMRNLHRSVCAEGMHGANGQDQQQVEKSAHE